jgi:hypothetical protein
VQPSLKQEEAPVLNSKNEPKQVNPYPQKSNPAKSSQAKSESVHSVPVKPPVKQRVRRWLPLIGVLGVLLVTLLYLDVFGFKAMLFSKQEMDPITQVRAPADFIESRLAEAKAAALLEQVPEPASGTLDLYVEDGKLFVVEDGVPEAFANPSAESGEMAGDLKLAFSFEESAPDQLNFLIGHADAPEYDMMRTAKIERIQGSAGQTYAVVRLFFDETGMPPIARVQNLSFAVLQNTNFELPKVIKAVLADGSESEVPVQWSPRVIDTTENGVRGSIGTIEGYDGEVTLTLIISDQMAVNDGIPAIGPPPEAIKPGAEAVQEPAPATEPEPAAKPEPTPAPTPTPTPAPKPEAKPAPEPAPKPAPATIQSLRSVEASVRQGEGYAMPTTVVAVMSDKTTKSVAVTWNPSVLDTASAGTKTSTGTVSGTTVKAALTLTVTKSALAAPSVAVSKISGADANVRVTGRAGATVLFNGYGVGTIGSGSVLTVIGVNVDTLQSVQLTMEGWDPSPVVTTFVLY